MLEVRLSPRMTPSPMPPRSEISTANTKARAVASALFQNSAVPTSAPSFCAVANGEVRAPSPVHACSACQAMTMPRTSRMKSPMRFIASPLQPRLQAAINEIEHGVRRGRQHDHQQHQAVHLAVFEIVVGVSDRIADPGAGEDELRGDDADEGIGESELDTGEQMRRGSRQ